MRKESNGLISTNKPSDHVLSMNLSCKWKDNILMAINVAGGKLIDAPSLCKRLAWKLQQLKLIFELMSLSLRCCVLLLESQGLSSTKSFNWVSSKAHPRDFYVKEEIAFLKGTMVFNCNFPFAYDKKSLATLNSSLEYFLRMNPHIREYISLFLDGKFKKCFKEVSEEDMLMCLYLMEKVWCSMPPCNNCKHASWTMNYSITCVLDNVHMIDAMEHCYGIFSKLGLLLVAALYHLVEAIGWNLTNGLDQHQSRLINWFFMHCMSSCSSDSVLNFNLVLHYHEDDFINVLIFGCQNFSVAAILHRKMINWGNIRDAKILIKWKTLPLKHGTRDCSSLRTRMFE
jgi:hypothetical protein